MLYARFFSGDFSCRSALLPCRSLLANFRVAWQGERPPPAALPDDGLPRRRFLVSSAVGLKSGVATLGRTNKRLAAGAGASPPPPARPSPSAAAPSGCARDRLARRPVRRGMPPPRPARRRRGFHAGRRPGSLAGGGGAGRSAGPLAENVAERMGSAKEVLSDQRLAGRRSRWRMPRRPGGASSSWPGSSPLGRGVRVHMAIRRAGGSGR
jgi:hypothetical protein